MLLITDNQHSNLQVKYFGDNLLAILKKNTRFDHDFTMTDTAYLAISKIIYDIQRDKLPLGMIKLLELSLNEKTSVCEKNLLKGISSMLNFHHRKSRQGYSPLCYRGTPRKEVDASKLGDSELWSTYFNPLLTSVISKTEDNILLRWTNEAAESYNPYRSDATISAMNNNDDLCLGYGECKLGNVSKNALDMNIVKLAIFTQRTININNKQNVFSVNIEGSKANFFVTSIENDYLYMMKKIGEVVTPRCLDDLFSFINTKHIAS